MNLNYLLKALSRKKLLLILIPLIALAASFLLTTDIKDQFRSRAQLATGFTIQDQVRITGDRLDMPETEAKFNNVLETLTSPKVISILSYAIMIHDLTPGNAPFITISERKRQSKEYLNVDRNFALESFKSHFDSLKILNSYNPKERDLIEYLKVYKVDYEYLTTKVLYVSRVSGTDFIDVYATTSNPDLSAFIVNTLCSQFLRYNNLDQAERSVASVEAFRKLLAQKKALMDKKSDSLMRYKVSHGVLNLNDEAKNKNEEISKYQVSLADEQNNYNSYKIELDNVNSQLKSLGNSSGGIVKPVVNNQEIFDLKQKISQLRAEQSSKGGNDDRLAKKILDLEDQLTDKMSLSDPSESGNDQTMTLKDKLSQRKSDLEVKMQASAQAISIYQNKIRSSNSVYSTYANKEASSSALSHDLEIATLDYNQANEKYNQAVNQKFATYNENIKQSLFGQPAVEPESSKRWLIIAMATVASFLLCIFIIVLLEYLDSSIKTPFVFTREVGLPLLGVINRVNLNKESLESLIASGNETESLDTEFRDFLKKLRYELDKKNSKLFLFTSNKAGEGKTTIIIALSSVLAAINKRVLLIDTNFSHNSLSQIYNCTLALEDFGNIDFDENHEVISKMIGKTNNKNIDIIGCKGGNYSPSEIFLKKGFFNALSKLTIYYDYIFMEGANLNQYADSKELAEFSDSLVAVFSARSVIKQNDMNSISFLKDLKDRFGGAILNNVELDNIDI